MSAISELLQEKKQSDEVLFIKDKLGIHLARDIAVGENKTILKMSEMVDLNEEEAEDVM